MAKKKKNSDGYDDNEGQLNMDDMLFNADQRHYRDTEQYVSMAEKLYNQAINRLTELATQVGNIPQSESFSFSHNKAVSKKVMQTISDLAAGIEAVVDSGCRHEWDAACIKGDKYIEQIKKTADLAEEKIKTYQDRNLEALAAFQERKVEGLNLSERVWKMVSPVKEEVELVVDTTAKYYDHGVGINTKDAISKIQHGIGSGTSAAELSREVRECLREPNKLFRRVRDKYGNLTLSKAAELYHPGQGVYRSSYKNAMRMCRTEINMAYRQSDSMRWQQLDFVVGMKINLSNNHTTKDPKSKGVIKLVDICDKLKGDYPKDFKFVGWHPQCRCFSTPILKTLDEIAAEGRNIDADGNIIPQQSQNAVTDVPDNYKKYMQDNAERIAGWSSTPYYIKDNPQYFDKAIHPERYKGPGLVLNEDQTKLMSELQAYGNNHQGSKKFAAAFESAQKAQLAGDMDAFEKAMKECEKIRKTNEGVREYLKNKKANKQTSAKDQRHQFDSRIDAIKTKALMYSSKKIDIDSIMDAYTSMDIKKIEKAIEQQEAIIKRHEEILEKARIRHSKRTKKEIAAIQTSWNDHRIQVLETMISENDLDRSLLDKFLLKKDFKKYDEIFYQYKAQSLLVEAKRNGRAGMVVYKKLNDFVAKSKTVNVAKYKAETAADDKDLAEIRERRIEAQVQWRLRNAVGTAHKPKTKFEKEYKNRWNDTIAEIQASLQSDEAKKFNGIVANCKNEAELLQALYAQKEKLRGSLLNSLRLGIDELKYSEEQRKMFAELEKLGFKRTMSMTYENADRQSANPKHVRKWLASNSRSTKYFDTVNGKIYVEKNPMYDETTARPNSINCQTCAPAYMLRRWGFDVYAKPNTPGSKLEYLSHGDNWLKAWKNKDGTSPTSDSIKVWARKKGYSKMDKDKYLEYFDDVCKEPGIYEIGILWEGNGGHCTIVERFPDGKIKYVEPQSDNSKGSGFELKDIVYLCSEIRRDPSRMCLLDGAMRVDDKLFNVSEYISIMNSKRKKI